MRGNRLPLVSVIIPVYKRPELLLKTLDSVYCQKGPFSVEIIVVDDCPEEPVKKHLGKKYPNLTYILNKTNLKSGPTRNVGLKKAKGEFIAFLDADDLWEENFLRRSIQALADEPQMVAAITLSQPNFDKGISIGFKIKLLVLSLIRDLLQLFYWITSNKIPQSLFYLCQLSHLVFRTNKIKDLKFDSDYNFGGEDWKYVLEAMDRGPIRLIPRRLVRYRYHPQSATFKKINLINKWNSYKQLFNELDKRKIYGLNREMFATYIGTFQSRKQGKSLGSRLPIFILPLLLAVFLITWFDASGRKPFWLDEIHSYNRNASVASIGQLLIHGANGNQGSPSPLSYIFETVLHQLRIPLGYLGVQPWQYYRVYNPLAIITCLYLLLAIWPSKRRWIFLVIAVTFLFNKNVGYFATEMRPYIVWTVLSFLSLFGVYPVRKHSRLWLASLMLLSLSATASIYQLAALFIALLANHVSVRLNDQKSLFPPLTASIVLLGLAVNLYYITAITDNGYPTPSWLTFWSFWKDYLPIAFAGLLLAYLNWRSKHQAFFVVSLTAAFWILVGPFSFLMTQQKGFFFDPRQYIYYVPVVSALIYVAITELFRPQPPVRRIFIFLITAYLTVFGFSKTTYGFQFAYHRLKTANEISIPTNYNLLKSNIPLNIPEKYIFIPAEPDELTNNLSKTNWEIYWTYLNEIYPLDRYSRTHTTLSVRSRGLGQELVKIE